MPEATHGLEINLFGVPEATWRLAKKFPKLRFVGLGEAKTEVINVEPDENLLRIEIIYRNKTETFDSCTIENLEYLVEERLRALKLF